MIYEKIKVILTLCILVVSMLSIKTVVHTSHEWISSTQIEF